MNKKIGAGKQPTGTPSLGRSCVAVFVSLLAGASVVYNMYKPSLVTTTIPLSLYISELSLCSQCPIKCLTHRLF
jgi:hypothetical protein